MLPSAVWLGLLGMIYILLESVSQLVRTVRQFQPPFYFTIYRFSILRYKVTATTWYYL
jgi:hypothetical protein